MSFWDSVIDDGVTDTLVTVGSGGAIVVTLTTAKPYLVLSTTDVAVTVTVAAVSPAATVRLPWVSILVPGIPPNTFHITA